MTWYISQWTTAGFARAGDGACVGGRATVTRFWVDRCVGALLGMTNPLGLADWRWMFLVSAIPNFILAIAAWFYFVDQPSEARWLDEVEKRELAARMSADGESVAKTVSWREAATDPEVWRCSLGWLFIMTGSYALVFWLPQLVRQMQLGEGELAIGMLSALPQVGLVAGLLVSAWNSDRTGERLGHVAMGAVLGAAALLLASVFSPGMNVLLLLTVGGFWPGCRAGRFLDRAGPSEESGVARCRSASSR